jgi:hypothetical protein
MRLETQLAILKQAGPAIPSNISFSGQNNMFLAPGKTQLRVALELARQLPYLSDEASTLLAFGTFTLASDELALPQEEARRFNSLLAPLRTKIDILLSALVVAVPEHSPYTVAVRLPPFDSFGQLEEMVHRFDQIFNQTIGASPRKSDLKAEIVGFDVGSNYLLVCLGVEHGVYLGLIRSRRRQMKGGYDGTDGRGLEEAAAAA